jgi:hypothetical protein
MNKIGPEQAVVVLNSLLLADKKAINNMFTIRVCCNNEVGSKYPNNITVLSHFGPSGQGFHQIGFLGIINALFRSSRNASVIGMTIDDGEIKSFHYYPKLAIASNKTKALKND